MVAVRMAMVMVAIDGGDGCDGGAGGGDGSGDAIQALNKARETISATTEIQAQDARGSLVVAGGQGGDKGGKCG